MFWRIPGFAPTASPVDAILDKGNVKLEELLAEDEIIQEYKARNSRLLNFFRDRVQVEQLVRYVVEEAPEDAESNRIFKFPFVACEIFTCDEDTVLGSLVDDDDLLNLLFSFLKPDHSHGPSLCAYFSKVVICLMMRKTVPLIDYVQGHSEIIGQLVDLVGITSIMEVLVRLIGADETMYSNHSDSLQWLEDSNVLEMIVDKFNLSDSPEVHANVAEILCAAMRHAPPALGAKICSPSFVERLFLTAFEDSRPKSVLVHSLSVCISLLDPKRLVSASFQAFKSSLSHGTLVTATPDTLNRMLENLGHLLKLLEVSSAENVLQTTYGILKPPFGKHRLKIVEFISVLLSIGSEAAETQLIQQGALKLVVELFFAYPFNNFLHHHVETIINLCLESKEDQLIAHVINDCNFTGKILEADKNSSSWTESTKVTIPLQGRTPPRIGNIGHMTRIANNISRAANINATLKSYLMKNSEWKDWEANVLLKRNNLEDVYQWECGRPGSLFDRFQDSPNEALHMHSNIAELPNNLTQANLFGNHNQDDDEDEEPLERANKDISFGNESTNVFISSHDYGDDKSSVAFADMNLFPFDDLNINDEPVDAVAAPMASENTPTDQAYDKNEFIGESDDNENSVAEPLHIPSSGDVNGGVVTASGNGPINTLEDDLTENSLEEVELTEDVKPVAPRSDAAGDDHTDALHDDAKKTSRSSYASGSVAPYNEIKECSRDLADDTESAISSEIPATG